MSRGIEAATWGLATKDADIRTSKSGSEFGIVNLAVQDGSTDDAGKQLTTYVKALAFGPHVATARTIKRSDRVYVEGRLSASIWKTADGEPRLDLSIRAFKLEKTGIGKNRPPRENSTTAGFQASQERSEAPAPAFDDEIPF